MQIAGERVRELAHVYHVTFATSGTASRVAAIRAARKIKILTMFMNQIEIGLYEDPDVRQHQRRAGMAGSCEYRQRAEEQRQAAASSELRMVQLMHKKAADRWDALAEEFERCESFRPEASGRQHGFL
ncbi:MAG: hypothetical protein R3E09_04000 [Novosphingobium sp.]|nr:hypothetical protein [Novosphingobium sp.]